MKTDSFRTLGYTSADASGLAILDFRRNMMTQPS